MKSKTKSCYIRHKKDRICQGDIFKDVKYFLWIDINDDAIEGEELIVPYLVVLTQECDLDLDHEYHVNDEKNDDKYLQSILVSPAYLSTQIREGTHLEGLNQKMNRINSKLWPNVKSNQNARYHYLPQYEPFKIPELVIDFKHYYTIPRDYFYQYYKDHYIGTIDQLFRENLSIRFSTYLSRIGLPIVKKSWCFYD